MELKQFHTYVHDDIAPAEAIPNITQGKVTSTVHLANVSLNGCHIIYHVNFLATTLLKK
jgi:hypothetical protein